MDKVIHYCWFGRAQKPKLVLKCIQSWKRFLPDYTITEWNEDNFDITANKFVSQAYEDKNFAFVSDYVRAFVLYNFGGIYLDTDVEVLGSFNKFLSDRFFLGFEECNFVGTCVMGADKNSELMKTYMNHYDSITYFNADGTKYSDTNVVLLTKLLEEKGLVRNNEKQTIDSITVYPRTYFSPYDYINGISYITEDSVAIHHFAQLWLPRKVRIKTDIKKALCKIIGGQNIKRLRQLNHKTGDNDG